MSVVWVTSFPLLYTCWASPHAHSAQAAWLCAQDSAVATPSKGMAHGRHCWLIRGATLGEQDPAWLLAFAAAEKRKFKKLPSHFYFKNLLEGQKTKFCHFIEGAPEDHVTQWWLSRFHKLHPTEKNDVLQSKELGTSGRTASKRRRPSSTSWPPDWALAALYKRSSNQDQVGRYHCGKANYLHAPCHLTISPTPGACLGQTRQEHVCLPCDKWSAQSCWKPF